MAPARSDYLKGAAFGFAAVSIWASWSVVTRLAVTTSLDASDIAALRFGVAGLLLSPVLVQRGLAHDRLGWLGLGVLIAGFGAPYALVAATGLRFAPAYDGGALNPGCMPLFVSLISAIVMREKLSSSRILGLSLILAGAVIIVGWHAQGRGAAWGSSRTFGDGLFLIAAFLTACSTLVMRRARTRSSARRSARSHRVAGDLSSYLRRLIWNEARADTARRPRGSGAVPGRCRDHCFPRPLWPRGCHPWRFRWIGFGRLGAGTVGADCHTASRRVAEQSRLGGHPVDLRRRLSGKRRTVAELETPGERYKPESLRSWPPFSSSRRKPAPMSAIGAGLRRCDNVLGAICQNCSAGARAGAEPVNAR